MRGYEAGIYDMYDDVEGRIIRGAVHDPDDLPDFVKTAARVSQDDNNRLFALVMVDGDSVMKKYATADPGNTWMSTLYFALTKDNLPPEAQKVAAANLIEACEAFDIEAPEMLFDVAGGPVDTNVVDVTNTQPMSKVAHSATAQEGDVHYAIERADGTKHYPLRDTKQVKTAMDYFDREEKNFVPRERREFAVKVASVASKARLPLTSSIKKYAGQGWNPALEGHLTTRYLHLVNAEADPSATSALMKLANVRGQTAPEDFASRLEVLDRELGLDSLWDKELADPWFSVMGGSFEKVAKGSVEPPRSFQVGATTVTQHELEVLAERGLGTLHRHFSHEFVNGFQKEPLAFFEGLGGNQKKFIARLAASFQDVS